MCAFVHMVDGAIKKWSNAKFVAYFVFAGEKKRNSFGTFEAALKYPDAPH